MGARSPLIEAGTRPAISQALVLGPILIAAAAVLAAVALSATAVGDQIRWGAIALGLFCVGLLLSMAAIAGYRGLGLSTWRIGPWAVAWSAVAFGPATISWIGPQSGPSAEILPGSILRALWLIAVAMTMFAVGYCTGPRRMAGSLARWVSSTLTSRFTNDIRSPAVPWVLFGIGIAGQLELARVTGHFGYVGSVASSVTTVSGYSQYFAVFGECVPLAVLAASVRAYRRSSLGAWLTLTVLFIGAIVVGAVSGAKTSFVVAVLAVIIPRAMIRRRLPAGAIALAVALFLLIVIPFNQAYRAAARGGEVTLSTREAVATAPAIASGVLASDFSPTVLGQSVNYLAQRIRTIDSPAIIMQRTPSQIPYSNPGQLAIAPVVDLIPRILWPGKPILDVGYQMSQEYYELPPQVYTSSDITPEGDLYRHGGWFAAIAGMFLIGCAARIIDEVTDLRRGIHGAFLIILLFPGLVQAGSDCATLLAGIPEMVLLWYAVTAISFTRRG
jgi:hypothetical protein